MTILTVIRDVCAVVGVAAPTSVFASIHTNRTMFEMASLAIEMAQRIATDARDFTALRTSAIYTGDGVTTAFNMPSNYRRMLKTSHVWRSDNTQQPMQFYPDTDEWMQRRANADSDAWGEWTIYGGQMHFWPALGAGITARYAYLDKNPVALTSGGYGERFMADTDAFRLDERILKLGMVWQWKANKGSPYAEDMGTYSDAIANAMGSDGPPPIYIGRTPLSAHGRIAYPWQVPT